MVKAVFFDVDGTLFPIHKKLFPKAQELPWTHWHKRESIAWLPPGGLCANWSIFRWTVCVSANSSAKEGTCRKENELPKGIR